MVLPLLRQCPCVALAEGQRPTLKTASFVGSVVPTAFVNLNKADNARAHAQVPRMARFESKVPQRAEEWLQFDIRMDRQLNSPLVAGEGVPMNTAF